MGEGETQIHFFIHRPKITAVVGLHVECVKITTFRAWSCKSNYSSLLMPQHYHKTWAVSVEQILYPCCNMHNHNLAKFYVVFVQVIKICSISKYRHKCTCACPKLRISEPLYRVTMLLQVWKSCIAGFPRVRWEIKVQISEPLYRVTVQLHQPKAQKSRFPKVECGLEDRRSGGITGNKVPEILTPL